MVKVLITCTKPRADELVREINNSIVNSALIVNKTDINIPDQNFDAVLVTSRHAITNDLPNLPIISIGEETALELKNRGHDISQVGTGGVKDLDLSAYNNVLYPCASESSFIPKNVTAWPVYETHPNVEFKIQHENKIICVFSAKAAKIIRTFDLSNKIILCLSKAIAKEFENIDIEKLAVCTSPRYDIMKSLIEQEIEAHT